MQQIVDKRGFTLIELVSFMTVFVVIAGVLIPLWQFVLRFAEADRINTATEMLVEDIAAMQQQAMLESSTGQQFSLMVNVEGDGYKILHNQTMDKQINFTERGWHTIRLAMPSINRLSFSNTGAPKNYISYRIYSMKKMGVKDKKVEVQPVSGRIVISD